MITVAGCNDNPVKPPEEKPEPFPLTYKFINVSDTSMIGGFDIRLAAYYPIEDSSHYRYTGLNSPAVGYQLKETFDGKNAGYAGAHMTMVFGAKKVWREHWPNQEPLYQTYKWFYIERCIVQDSTKAIMNFVWPQDTARPDVHEFVPDTTDPNFQFWGPNGSQENC